MRGTNKTNEEMKMKKILKEIIGDFKKNPVQNTIGWFVVIPVSIPFIVANYLLISLIWILSNLRLAVCYPMAKLIFLVEKINK